MSDDKKKKLGRGLSALLGEASGEGTVGGDFGRLPIEKLHPGKYQPRRAFAAEAMDSLVASVREQGVVQPLLVRPHPAKPGEYEIIAGERRWRAAQAAQVHDVPVHVRDMSDREALEIALVENIQRQDLSPMEEAEGYRRLMEEFGHTQDALGKALGKSRSHIANMLRLLGLPDDIRAMVDRGDLTAGHARALLTASHPSLLAQQVVEKGLSVREVEQLVQRQREDKDNKSLKTSKSSGDKGKRQRFLKKDPDTRKLEEDLSLQLGVAVEFDMAEKGGVMRISFEDWTQLDPILARIIGS